MPIGYESAYRIIGIIAFGLLFSKWITAFEIICCCGLTSAGGITYKSRFL